MCGKGMARKALAANSLDSEDVPKLWCNRKGKCVVSPRKGFILRYALSSWLIDRNYYWVIFYAKVKFYVTSHSCMQPVGGWVPD